MSEKSKNHKSNTGKKNSGETPAEGRKVEIEVEKSVGETEGAGEPAAEKAELAPEEQIQAQLEEKSKEAAAHFDQWLRLRAEFENFKKRMQKEKADLMKFGNENLLKAILPALDNLERAIEHGKRTQDNDSLLGGVEMTRKQLLSMLEKFGVKPIRAVGELFNPEQHEAIAQEESEQEPNRVVTEVEKGYLFHDRLLRPAKVTVSKTKNEG